MQQHLENMSSGYTVYRGEATKIGYSDGWRAKWKTAFLNWECYDYEKQQQA